MRLFGKISSTPSNLKVVELRFCFWLYSLSIQSKQSPMGNDKVTIIYRVAAIHRSSLRKNIRQLKILGSCMVTVIYGVTAHTGRLYKFDRIML